MSKFMPSIKTAIEYAIVRANRERTFPPAVKETSNPSKP